MPTCNRLDLQALGSQPVIMSKNLPDHCSNVRGDLGTYCTWKVWSVENNSPKKCRINNFFLKSTNEVNKIRRQKNKTKKIAARKIQW